ncbi:alpha/beta hydrolase-fold protein [Jiangella sp. DSM 45060]|uniref:alpha/beta hydrolase-fold protein n=1 Tax=Jiangella sp. DSM 45060 TaxID=1798224 RepID=UPI00087AF8EE|nr:alpha/beta hydrolase-fold protein [Jiangella sp. DSM 45060]SDS48553.1 Enterochelin esterase [Jiangella sp. DSM 45060]
MHLARLHRSPEAPPGRRRLRSLLAGLTAAAAMTAGAAAPSASAAPPEPLGPQVVRTDQPPTGHAVTFRYEAPEGVESVHIYGDWFYSRPERVTCQDCGDGRPPSEWLPGDIAATPWQILPMERGDDGVWSITVPLPAGSFRYAFTHDCTNLLATGCTLHDDPANPWQIQPQYPGAPGAVRSTVYVPESKKFPTYDTDYQAPPRPHQAGTLETRRYPSPLSTNPAGVHDIVVYLPHGYDPDRATPYPTLYLSHGGGDHSTAWTMQGVAHHILENAIQDGAVQPMVIVSTDFNGLPGGNQGYVDELRNNVFPFVEQNYNVSTRAQDRAFGGFSAGGSRAYTLMYDHTELFGYHAAWSAGGPQAGQEQIDRMKDVAGGIMIGTGLQDRLGNIAENSQRNAAALRAAGVVLDEYNVPGVHTWHVWRPLLNHYVRDLAFRATTTELAVDAEPVGRSHNVRLTAVATVDPVTTSVTEPSGTVDFYAGDQYLGSARVRDGVARFHRPVDAALLDQPVTADYRGDDLFNGSRSAPVDLG